MGKLKVIGLAALIIIHSACGSNENQNQNSSQTAPAENQEQSIPKLGDFMKSYDGALDSKHGVNMTISRIGNTLYGSYAYKSVGKAILLSGNADESGKVTLTEYNDKGKSTGFFEGNIVGTTLSGTWKSADGKKNMPFALNETSSTANMNEIKKVYCFESTEEQGEGIEPAMVKTCIYKGYKTVSTAYADGMGRYTYFERIIYKIQPDNKFAQIKNSAMFNDSNAELLNRINAELKKQYDSYSKEGALDGCYDGKPFKSFKMDDLGVEFQEKGVDFSATFGFYGACAAVNEGVISISIDEMQKYIVE